MRKQQSIRINRNKINFPLCNIEYSNLNTLLMHMNIRDIKNDMATNYMRNTTRIHTTTRTRHRQQQMGTYTKTQQHKPNDNKQTTKCKPIYNTIKHKISNRKTNPYK